MYDTEAGVQVALELLEYANSQLLAFRYYDDRLERDLAAYYHELEAVRRWPRLGGRGYTRAARRLHALFIDINELTDRTENALKMVGDVYAARVYDLAAARLGVGRWKRSVDDKPQTLSDIYTFAAEDSHMVRGNFLELVIVLILLFELVLFFMGVMQ